MLPLNGKRILLSKINQIGDATFALPIASKLKQVYPECVIAYLGQGYVGDLIHSYADVDEFINWDELKVLPFSAQVAELKSKHFDAIIHIHPQKAIAKLAKAAAITYRVGTSHRLYHLLTCNRWVNLSRKKSLLHETQLDMALLAGLGLPSRYSLEDIIQLQHYKPMPITPSVQEILHPDRFNLIIHPLTRGRHIEWPLARYAELIKNIDIQKFNVIVTGSPAEAEEIRQGLAEVTELYTDTMGQLDLQTLTRLIAHADGLIASSTGPVHLAANFGIHTLGLYAPIKPFDAARWGPVGPKAEVLSLSEKCSLCRDGRRCACVARITLTDVKNTIESWL